MNPLDPQGSAFAHVPLSNSGSNASSPGYLPSGAERESLQRLRASMQINGLVALAAILPSLALLVTYFARSRGANLLGLAYPSLRFALGALVQTLIATAMFRASASLSSAITAPQNSTPSLVQAVEQQRGFFTLLCWLAVLSALATVFAAFLMNAVFAVFAS